MWDRISSHGRQKRTDDAARNDWTITDYLRGFFLASFLFDFESPSIAVPLQGRC